ncbi:hypothetical protein HOF92_13765 [bacterium]|jgi:hypothetical protein|nr:hypothetical protein [bacterium]
MIVLGNWFTTITIMDDGTIVSPDKEIEAMVRRLYDMSHWSEPGAQWQRNFASEIMIVAPSFTIEEDNSPDD